MLIISLFTIFIGKFMKKEDRLSALRENKIFLWGLRLMIVLPIAKVFYNSFISKPSNIKEFYSCFIKSSFYHYAIAAGLLLCIAAIVLTLIKPGEMIRDKDSASLSIMFFYLVLI